MREGGNPEAHVQAKLTKSKKEGGGGSGGGDNLGAVQPKKEEGTLTSVRLRYCAISLSERAPSGVRKKFFRHFYQLGKRHHTVLLCPVPHLTLHITPPYLFQMYMYLYGMSSQARRPPVPPPPQIAPPHAAPSIHYLYPHVCKWNLRQDIPLSHTISYLYP